MSHFRPDPSSHPLRTTRLGGEASSPGDPFLAVARNEPVRTLAISPLQAAMWRDSSLHGDGRNVEQLEIRFREGLDEGRVMDAWRATVRATAALRSGFISRDGETCAVFPVGRANGELISPAAPDDWESWLAADRRTPFVEGDAPWRVVCFPGLRTFVWTFHHALLDGRSISRVVKSFLARLEGVGDAVDLPLLQFTPPEGGIISRAAEFHRRAYDGVEDPRLEYPGDANGGPVRVSRRLGDGIRACLEAVARRFEVTVPTLVTWAWGQAFARLAGVAKTAIGQIRAGSPQTGMAGFSMNAVPLAIERFAGGDIGETLKRFRADWLALRAIETVAPESLPAGTLDSAMGPWPGGVVMVEHGTLEHHVAGSEVVESIRLHEYAGQSLLASAWIRPELDLEVETDGLRFGQKAASAMIDQWAAVLMALGDSDGADVTLLAPALRDAAHCHESGGPPVARLHVVEVWNKAVQTHPERLAMDGGDATLSYAELDALAVRLSARLHAAGVRSGDRVAGLFNDRRHLAVVLLACARTGAIHVPLDTALPEKRLFDIIDDAAPGWMLTDDAAAASRFKLPIVSLKPEVDDIPITGGTETFLPDDPLSLLYTSGSTGRPKGVVMVNGGVCNEALAIAGIAGIEPGDRLLQFASPGFDASLEEILAALLSGATLVPRPPGFPPDFDEFERFLTVNCVTILDLPTAHWAAWCAWMVAENRHIPDCVRATIIGGERASVAAVGDWFKAGGRRVRLVNTYGPTEASIVATAEVIGGDWNEETDPAIGRPLAGVLARVSADDGTAVAPGAAGELWLGGACVGPGYWNRPELTAEAFREIDGIRWYRTGDRVFRDAEGKLRFLGRLDEQLKIRGNRIEPNEVIRVLETFPGVSAAHVGPVAGSDGSLALAAWIRWDGSPPDEWPAELAKHAAAKLPAAAVPTRWARVAEFKLTERGKLDRSSLPEPALAKGRGNHPLRASTSTEGRLMDIWSEILGTGPIGRDDSFFDLGGHSLAALRMFAHVAKVWQLRIPMATLIQAPTPRLFAKVLDDRRNEKLQHGPAPVVMPVRSEGELPPLFCIHGGDGGVFFYQELADHLKTGRPILAIESPALGDAGEVKPVPVGETAASYIEALRNHQAQGPYHLIGYSYGGLLVYEMARQLLADGETVGFAGLVDTVNPAAPIREYSLLERAEVFWESQAHPDLFERIRRLIGRAFNGLSTHLRVKGEIRAARNAGRSDPYSEIRMLQVREAHWESMKAFQPEPLDCPIVLFKSRSANDKFELPADYGWTPLVRSIDMVEVPGEHLTIFDSRHVGHLAKELQRRIG